MCYIFLSAVILFTVGLSLYIVTLWCDNVENQPCVDYFPGEPIWVSTSMLYMDGPGSSWSPHHCQATLEMLESAGVESPFEAQGKRGRLADIGRWNHSRTIPILKVKINIIRRRWFYENIHSALMVIVKYDNLPRYIERIWWRSNHSWIENRLQIQWWCFDWFM